MTNYDKNLKVINKKYPELLTKIKDLDIVQNSNLHIFTSKSGYISGRYFNNYIHSKFNPKKEAEKLISTECRDEITSCIFYGFGLH